MGVDYRPGTWRELVNRCRMSNSLQNAVPCSYAFFRMLKEGLMGRVEPRRDLPFPDFIIHCTFFATLLEFFVAVTGQWQDLNHQKETRIFVACLKTMWIKFGCWDDPPPFSILALLSNLYQMFIAPSWGLVVKFCRGCVFRHPYRRGSMERL